MARFLLNLPRNYWAVNFRTRMNMRMKSLGLTFGIACLGAGLSVHAAPIVLTPTANYQKDLSWQEIKKTTYTFADANANNQVDVGETVSFTVEMAKKNWGRHDFDALKVWINTQSAPSSLLYTDKGIWNFATGNNSPAFDYKPWLGGTKSFTFHYTFANAGLFDFTASVMCSADLSDLVGNKDDKPTTADWNAWAQNIHTLPGWRQGETEKYTLQVHPAAVPEPGTMALFLLGFAGMAGFGRFLRRK